MSLFVAGSESVRILQCCLLLLTAFFSGQVAAATPVQMTTNEATRDLEFVEESPWTSLRQDPVGINIGTLPQASVTERIKIHWTEQATLRSALVLRVSRLEKGEILDWEECQALPVLGQSIDVVPAQLICAGKGGSINDGGLISLEFAVAGQTVYAAISIPNRKMPILGTDIGLALTLTDRLHDGKAFRVHTGASGYYSLARLFRSQSTRVVGHLSLLDHDPDQDFELGLGLGILFRAGALKSDDGLGLAFGYGYNLMADDSGKAWYSFLGLSWNVTGAGR